MISSGYDFVMIVWGLIFVIAASLFIYLMNRVFQFEQRRQDIEVSATVNSQSPTSQGH
ncbi:MAG TPA: hypothetical protein VFZ25_14300 [Chloroflexota bacterium]|nr:hypothetical protein [Chloroflexota bacterium]